ncbi:unnamed protein product [Rotaria magnacalcarata]|uniref:Uncharacterized protein n=1 Tax=Rotaria magnacalcarata TaxID=392030 RepID=A0A819QBT0_9BILA|nr:unnamed protein product [Rotaria magnacalcarata]CAF5055706.1 unnamed protein product [Rotaria magnacalcarata]CAF5184202.1 unnamed protein product [Rotaria magnacalcarata]
MFSTILVYVSIFLIFVSTTNTQQLEWILLSDGTSTDTPQARRDAALGFDQTFLLLYGGRTQTGIPLQDSYSFNILSGNQYTHEGRSLGVSLGFQANLCGFVKSGVNISNIAKLAAKINPLKNLE